MRRTPPQAAVAACALVFALALAACGTSSDHTYKNAARPPTPIVISAAIDDQRVSISPKRFGAGPITLLISNQSNATQQVTLETVDEPGTGPGEKAVETGPINPHETASVKAVVEPGTYQLHTEGGGVRPVELTIGRSRPSAQNDLLQP